MFMKLERFGGRRCARSYCRLRRSTAFRYIYDEIGLYLCIKDVVSRYFWGGEEEFDPRYVSPAVDVRNPRSRSQPILLALCVARDRRALPVP